MFRSTLLRRDPLTPKPRALSRTGESRCWHSCIIHHSTNNPRLHQEGWEQFDWIDKKGVCGVKARGGRRRIRQWKYAFDSFHSLRGLWFTLIHIVSNLIWNNPGQGGESAAREHETVLASLKRQQRRSGRGVNEGFTASKTTDGPLSGTIRQTGPKTPKIDTLLHKHAYPHTHTHQQKHTDTSGD